jgi:predicted oxidoreductase (fatty acid repression mutant protein)
MLLIYDNKNKNDHLLYLMTSSGNVEMWWQQMLVGFNQCLGTATASSNVRRWRWFQQSTSGVLFYDDVNRRCGLQQSMLAYCL